MGCIHDAKKKNMDMHDAYLFLWTSVILHIVADLLLVWPQEQTSVNFESRDKNFHSKYVF